MFWEGHRNLKTIFKLYQNEIGRFCLKFWGLSWVYKLKHYKTSDLLDNLNVVSGANLRLNTDDVIQNQERQLNAAKRSILRMLGNILKHIFLLHVKYGCKTFQPWNFQPQNSTPHFTTIDSFSTPFNVYSVLR